MNFPSSQFNQPETGGLDPVNPLFLNAHVVVLNNYIRRHHVVGFRELAKRVRKLTVLLSTSMEPDRKWEAQWEDLDVRVQKNLMLTTNWKHSAGFEEPNFIHIPIDTNSQLKSLRPDIIFSYEMGMRTLLSSWFRRFHRDVPLVVVGNMSEHIERERGALRRCLRWVIRRGVDYYTYNGPSCKRYLESLSISEDRLFHVPYCIDPEIVYRGDPAGENETGKSPRRMLYCGAMSERKGILQFCKCLKRWSQKNPGRLVELSIAGSGPLEQDIAECETDSLSIKFLGACDAVALRAAYGMAEICVFPTLADEWGLVPIESLASGVPVLGSIFAQSVETVVEEGSNGWIFEPTDSESMFGAISRAMKCSTGQLLKMGHDGKQSVAHINAKTTADKFCDVIKHVMPHSQNCDTRLRTNPDDKWIRGQTR